MIQKKYLYKRSQDLLYTYHDAAQFCWGTVNSWVKRKKVISNKSKIIEIPRNRSIDIDEIEDWNTAEIKYKILNK